MTSKPSSGARRARDASAALTISGSAALTLGVALSPSLDAATFNVTNLNDAGAGSLRQALVDANTTAGADIVAFQPGLTGTITLTTGQLYIEDSVDVQGPGSADITVSGNNASRVFYVYSAGSPIDVTISGLTVADGADIEGAGILSLYLALTLDDVSLENNTSADVGGGLAFIGGTGALTISNSTISGNSSGFAGGGAVVIHPYAPVEISNSVISANSAYVGGGLAVYYAGASVTLRDCTISGNQALVGGGIAFYASIDGDHLISGSTISGNAAAAAGGLVAVALYSPLLLENSTISGNQALQAPGGGIFVYSAYAGAFSIRFSTIAGNTSSLAGGGVVTYFAGITIDHSIIGDNTAPADPDIATGAEPSIDLSFSLVESPGSATLNDNGGNIFSQDPQLGALANNGGPTFTHLPAATSPAVNSGNAAFAPPPAVDQRGLPRPVGIVDMGAVELQAASVVAFTFTVVSVDEIDGTVTVTVARTGGTVGAVSVDYATAPGSAVTPGDYGHTAGTLNWADGDGASQDIVIPIVNDIFGEPAETFTITLSNPTGATIGANSTVTITINPSPAVSVTQVPALGWWARLFMMIGTAVAGVWALSRKLFVVFLLALLASAGSSEAWASSPQAREKQEKVVLIRSVSGGSPSKAPEKPLVTIGFADGSSVIVTEKALRVTDHRGDGKVWRDGKAHSLKDIPSDQPALVRIRIDKNGDVKRVRVKLFDTVEQANEELGKHGKHGKSGKRRTAD